ncbi:MAG: adenylate kinase [Euryarchaeota archaeon]|nr:adenylate kinase [Euryarchaeota archaeon]
MKKVILITGTPGVGKSTVSTLLKKKLKSHLIKINEVVDEEVLYSGYDERRKFKIVDLDALCNHLNEMIQNLDGFIIIEGHLSHYLKNSDVVIVLRANPDVLKERLEKKRFSELKINENIEAEALAICAYEAWELHKEKVNEIDTSDISPEKVTDTIIDVIEGNKKFPVGNVDFLESFYQGTS